MIYGRHRQMMKTLICTACVRSWINFKVEASGLIIINILTTSKYVIDQRT